MRRRLASAALVLVAGMAGSLGCRRGGEPARTATVTPASAAIDTPEAREARQKRSAAAAGLAGSPGVAVERSPLLLDPDYGAPVAGTLEEGMPVEVLLAEPGFYGIRTGEKGLAFVPARSVRLLPGAASVTSPVSRPRREIVPKIVPLSPDAGTALPGTGTPAATVSPTPGAGP